MANWLTQIQPLLNRTFALYSAGQTIGAGGGVSVNPVLKVDGIKGSIQTLTGEDRERFSKTLIEGSHYFMCLQDLSGSIKNGDIILDDANVRYRVTWWEDNNLATGRYFAIVGLVIRQ